MAEEVSLDLDKILRTFEHLSGDLPAAIFAAMTVSAEAMLADVVRNRMSGQYLGVVTGNARRSMQGFARAQGNTISAIIGNPFRYVRAHELGFQGTVQVKAHERRRLGAIKARNIRTRQVTKRGKPTKAQMAAGPIHVRAHDMHMNVRAKYFMRDTVRDAVVPTTDRIKRAVLFLARNGRPPGPGDLGTR